MNSKPETVPYKISKIICVIAIALVKKKSAKVRINRTAKFSIFYSEE